MDKGTMVEVHILIFSHWWEKKIQSLTVMWANIQDTVMSEMSHTQKTDSIGSHSYTVSTEVI